jgi:hypothetical protein
MPKRLDLKAKTRVWVSFFFLFVAVAGLSVGAYYLTHLGTVQESIASRERQAAPQGLAESRPVDEALKRHPANKLLQMIAMAIKAANERNDAADKLLTEIEPPSLAKDIDLGTASRSDLDVLRRDLKTAQANAMALVPRYAALVKAERDKLEANARSLRADNDTIAKFLDGVDQRHAEATALFSRLLSARADYYRAYESCVVVLAGEFGTYKVVGGKFIFPLPRTVERYNSAISAMAATAQRAADLQEERTRAIQSLQHGWDQLVSSK